MSNRKLRFLTAGESHGPALSIIVDGLPAGLTVEADYVNKELARRQGGYGRGLRMQIEKDKIEFLGGIRHAYTMGGPVSMNIINADHQKWLEVMNTGLVDSTDPEIKKKLDDKLISKVRPGHADFAGAIKYNHSDVRNILERSSARETTSRVAAGALAKRLLEEFGIKIRSHVIRIGSVGIDGSLCGDITEQEWETIENSPTRCKDSSKTEEMKKAIDTAKSQGETLGGVVELIAYGVPIGLGSHIHWDKRLDGIISQYLMSVHTAKSVGFGIGSMVGVLPGSEVHDQMQVDETPEDNPVSNYERLSNRAGGIEGGMSNGEPIVAQVALKPIPTLAKKEEDALKSINLGTKSNDKAFYERSDVCVVPAGGVVCEAMFALSLAEQFLLKFGGDSVQEIKNNYQSYLDYCKTR